MKINAASAPRRRKRSSSPGTIALLALCFGFTPGSALHAEETITLDKIRQQLSLTKSFGCTIRTMFPAPSFDFRMHSPYLVLMPSRAILDSKELYVRVWTVPLKDAQGKPFQPPKQTHFTVRRYRTETILASDRHFLRLTGSIATGAGEYRHFLAIDDGKGGGCWREWRVKAKPPRNMVNEISLEPGEVRDPRLVAFSRQRRVEKQANGLRVAVMLNADNRSWRRVLADGDNMVALAAALRRIAEDERVREVALTVFTLEDQEVLYEESFQEEVNFRQLASAFRQLKPGQIEVTKLSLGSEARFLAQVLQEREQRMMDADLVVFAGARSPVNDKVSPAVLESLGPLRGRTVTYLVTNPFPIRSREPLSRDVVGHAVKALGGGEKSIRVPADLARAVNQVIDEAVRTAGAAASRDSPAQ